MEINCNNDLIKLFKNANSIDYSIYEPNAEIVEFAKLSKSELDIICQPLSDFTKSVKTTEIIQKGNAMMILYFLHLAKNGKSFMNESCINEYLRTDLNKLGCDKGKQPFYNIAKAYWTLKALIFKVSSEAEDNILVAYKLLEELELNQATFWFPSLGGEGYSHSERKQNTKKALSEFNIFSNDELDLIFTQMPLYKQPSPSSSTSSGCFIATATYGSPLAEEVIVLKKWRDEKLMQTNLGNIIIKFYYFCSPSVAEIIVKSSKLKNYTSALLYPIIRLLKFYGYGR